MASKIRIPFRPPTAVALVVVLTVIACALRICAGFGDLWLDEVWSIQLADSFTRPWHIVTQLRSDNNHMLNTAYVACLGSDQPPILYRLHSIVAGTLSVIVVGAIAGQRGQVERWTAMVLVGGSFLMVQYSAEARGYALALMFALTSYWCLLRFTAIRGEFPRQHCRRYVIGFACCASCGFLAHPTFLYFYVTAGYWTLTKVLEDARHWSEAIKPVAMLHGLPGCVAIVLYLANFRYLKLGGGPEYELVGLFAQTGSLAIGGPAQGAGAVAGAFVLVVAVAGGLWVLWRQGDAQWKVLAFCVVLPLVAAVVSRTPFLFVRYFLIAIVFAQLLCAFSLAWLYRRGPLGQLGFAAILALFLVGNLLHLGNLYRFQRGHYLAALSYIAEQNPGETVTIGSNHDHGTSILVDFYRRRVQEASQIEYCRISEWPADGPNWLILHHDPTPGPANYLPSYVVDGQTYRLSRTFDAAILSGWQWFCYRQVPGEAMLAEPTSREMLNVAAVSDR